MQKHFQEDIRGTAIDHLGKGLFEAHGRDEAGWEEEAGHKDMWFAARDVAFENPTAKIDIDAMLARMGFGQPGGPGGIDVERALPDDIDVNLELIANLMIRVLLIEIQAFHTFAWAEAWLADPDLVARRRPGGRPRGLHPGRRDAPRGVPQDRPHRDARPHLGRAPPGKTYAGTDMIGTLWTRGLDQSLGDGRQQTRKAVLGEVEHWCLQHDGGADILAEFHSLATPDRRRRLSLGPEQPSDSRLRGRGSARRSAGGGSTGSGVVLTSSTRPSGPSIDRVWAVSSNGHMPASDWHHPVLLLHLLRRAGPPGGGEGAEGEVVGGEAVAGGELVHAGGARHAPVVTEGEHERLVGVEHGLRRPGARWPTRCRRARRSWRWARCRPDRSSARNLRQNGGDPGRLPAGAGRQRRGHQSAEHPPSDLCPALAWRRSPTSPVGAGASAGDGRFQDRRTEVLGSRIPLVLGVPPTTWRAARSGSLALPFPNGRCLLVLPLRWSRVSSEVPPSAEASGCFSVSNRSVPLR